MYNSVKKTPINYLLSNNIPFSPIINLFEQKHIIKFND